MSNLKHQSDLTDGKGWKQVIVEHAKKRVEQAKTKVENIIGGIKATPAAIKKTFKKDED
jgi:asparagine synthetase A